LIPASFCHLATIGSTSTIGCLLSLINPVAFEALLLISFTIEDLVVLDTIPSFNVSKITFASFTDDALSNAFNTLSFWLSLRVFSVEDFVGVQKFSV
jgi:hypothetical protein